MTHYAEAASGADKGCTCIHLTDGGRIRDPQCAAPEHRRT